MKLPIARRSAAAAVGVLAALSVTVPAYSTPAPPAPVPSVSTPAATPDAADDIVVQNPTPEILAARARVTDLRIQAELAAERYNASQVRLDAAHKDYAAAQDALAAAQARVAKARVALDNFAAGAYMSGGQLPTVSALMSANGPADLTESSGLLQQVGVHHTQVLADLRAAQRAASDAQDRADAAVRQATQAAADADMARRQADQETTDAETLLRSLETDQARAEQQAKDTAAAAAASAALTTSPAALADVSPAAQKALQVAFDQLGKPYVWAAAGPAAFDCSGLVMFAYAAAGVQLPRVSQDQQAQLPPVPLSALRPGDLVFFGTPAHHVGIFVGNGMMIDAPHTGANVRVESIFWSDLSSAARPAP